MRKITLLLALLTVSIFNYVSAQSTSPAPYCAVDFDDEQFNIPDAINSVSFGSLLNTTNAQSAAPHYLFYNNLPVANFTPGNQYTLSVDFEVNGGCGYGVWIDWNHNNTFEPSEKLSGTPVNNSLDITPDTIITESVTIPLSAMFGTTRMRVRIVEDDNYTMGQNG